MSDRLKNEEKVELTFMQITLSVLASMFGVQSNKNRRRDFEHGNPIHFIAGGIIFAVLFVVSVLVITQLAIN